MALGEVLALELGSRNENGYSFTCCGEDSSGIVLLSVGTCVLRELSCQHWSALACSASDQVFRAHTVRLRQ